MSRASSHALKHPPVTAPSEPAGAPSAFPELAVAIERERRHGRGAQSNASSRFEAEARVAFDDGWQSLDELPPFKTTVALDTSRKVIARNDSPDIGFDRSGHPVGIVTKSALVTRDIDILSRMANRQLVKVALSVTTLDPALARTMEPRAPTPPRRLEALRQLSAAGIPTTVMVAPVIPA